jgi:hypothetical protein
MNWLERAEQEIDEDYEKGNLTNAEYRLALSDLYAEHDQCRQEAAQSAYETY